MRPGYYTVTIPTRPYILKYFATLFGNPLLLNNQTITGIVILSLLQKKVCTHYDLKQKHLQFRGYTAKITTSAPYRLMSSYGVDLNDNSIIQINRYLDARFAEDLYIHCLSSIVQDARYKGYDEAITHFARLHNIEIDVDTTFENLKKIEYRYRKEREKKLLSPLQLPTAGDSEAFLF